MSTLRAVALLVAAATLTSLASSSSLAAQLYWIDAVGIHRASLDGSAQQLIVPATGSVMSMAVDASSNKVYWIEAEVPTRIRRANLDGTSAEPFLTVDQASGGIFGHPTTHDLWWGGSLGVDDNSVFRTTADGLATTMVFKPEGGPDGDVNDFFIDADAGKLYNLDTDDDVAHRVNLDGTGSEVVGGGNVMAVVPSQGKIYFGNRRSNLDGSNHEVLFDTPVMPTYLAFAVDPVSSTMYMGEYEGSIYRMNLDGSNLQLIITGTSPVGKMLVVEPVPEPSTLAMLLAALPLAYLAYRRR
jgi:hypothetical protein